ARMALSPGNGRGRQSGDERTMEEEIDDAPVLGRGDELRLVKHLLIQHGGPAYMRRARQTEEAFETVVRRCRRQRDEWLDSVRLRRGTLRALAGSWEQLRPVLADDAQVDLLVRLHEELAPRLRLPVERTSSQRTLRRALCELIDSLERFNHRWLHFLETVD